MAGRFEDPGTKTIFICHFTRTKKWNISCTSRVKVLPIIDKVRKSFVTFKCVNRFDCKYMAKMKLDKKFVIVTKYGVSMGNGKFRQKYEVDFENLQVRDISNWCVSLLRY